MLVYTPSWSDGVPYYTSVSRDEDTPLRRDRLGKCPLRSRDDDAGRDDDERRDDERARTTDDEDDDDDPARVRTRIGRERDADRVRFTEDDDDARARARERGDEESIVVEANDDE